MTTLLVHEMRDVVYQEITVKHLNMDVEAIRPHLYIHNKPSGTVQVQIRDLNDKKVAVSNTLTIADLTTLNYCHGYFKFDIRAALRATEVYRIALITGGGYSFSESAYLGWCNGWDSRPGFASYALPLGTRAPLDFEVWENREIVR